MFWGILDVGLIVMFGMLLVHYVLGFRTSHVDGYSMFECGFDGLDYSNESLDCEVLYFVIIFLVFDLELIVFIYWCSWQTCIQSILYPFLLLLSLLISSSILEVYTKIISYS
jgi:NADH:ubiquinone oxidoreductase subunit 3 (subunit A)